MADKKESKDVEVKKAESEGASGKRTLAPYWDFDRDFEQTLERFFDRRWPRGISWPSLKSEEGKTPSVDVIDRDDEVVVRAELPGVEKKDLDVSLTESTLTIKATTKTEEKEEKGDYHRREIRTGSFSRTMRLPAQVSADQAKAEFKDGVLTLNLPKVPEAKKQAINIE